MMTKSCLYIVATPIGNLADISQHAIDTLNKVDLIACEDTRHSKKLLMHFQIKTPLISLHEHNETERINQLIKELENGKNIALISDAGTPLINDPGFILVREVRKKGFKVMPIPGPCALIAALSASGLPTERFVFEGFLPVKTQARKNYLEKLQNESRTLIFYEAPHRLLATINDLIIIFGTEREVVIAKELTKKFETINHQSLAEMKLWLVENPDKIKGEFVLLVKGYEAVAEEELDAEVITALKALLAELPLKQAVKLAETITKKPKNSLYNAALRLKNVV